MLEEPLDLDLTGIRILPPEGEDFIDRSPLRDWHSSESGSALLSSKILPALGLEDLERDRFGFHVVGGSASAGENLIDLFGEEEALLIDADRFKPDHFTHQVDVLFRG